MAHCHYQANVVQSTASRFSVAYKSTKQQCNRAHMLIHSLLTRPAVLLLLDSDLCPGAHLPRILPSSQRPRPSVSRSLRRYSNRATSRHTAHPQTLAARSTTVLQAYRDGEHNGNAAKAASESAAATTNVGDGVGAAAEHAEASLIGAASIEAAAAVMESMPRVAGAEAVAALADKLEDMTGK